MSEISITETELRRKEDQILDVREAFEITEGMIPGPCTFPSVN